MCRQVATLPEKDLWVTRQQYLCAFFRCYFALRRRHKVLAKDRCERREHSLQGGDERWRVDIGEGRRTLRFFAVLDAISINGTVRSCWPSIVTTTADGLLQECLKREGRSTREKRHRETIRTPQDIHRRLRPLLTDDETLDLCKSSLAAQSVQPAIHPLLEAIISKMCSSDHSNGDEDEVWVGNSKTRHFGLREALKEQTQKHRACFRKILFLWSTASAGSSKAL